MYTRRRKRVVIARPIRFTLFLSVVILLLLFTLNNISRSNTAFGYSKTNNKEYTTIIVQAGDTLWSIATNHYDCNMDKRRIIYEIQRANNKKTANLRIGEQLKLPPLY
ncbi:LysM peptidoglycan-binding domain-containing protein [Clostridiaceae bacterium M8S5]|nr:LysM peptidoglycan-binding domain-containing protein [Clostridiaceae bacterium M8S5]